MTTGSVLEGNPVSLHHGLDVHKCILSDSREETDAGRHYGSSSNFTLRMDQVNVPASVPVPSCPPSSRSAFTIGSFRSVPTLAIHQLRSGCCTAESPSSRVRTPLPGVPILREPLVDYPARVAVMWMRQLTDQSPSLTPGEVSPMCPTLLHRSHSPPALDRSPRRSTQTIDPVS